MVTAPGKGVCSGLNTSEAPGGRQVKQIQTAVSLVLKSFIFQQADILETLCLGFPWRFQKHIQDKKKKSIEDMSPLKLLQGNNQGKTTEV